MQRLAFRIPAGAREDVLDGILPLLPAGIVERPVADGLVEIASVGAVLPPRERLEAAARRPLEAFELEPVPADWRERRRRFGGGSILIAGRLLVRSPWDPPAPDGVLEIVIERGGSGFGSGSHPTTQMCLGLLTGLEPAGGAADLGCGVGTLAIAAAKLGWEPVSGLDRDASAVEDACANAQRNGVAAEFATADVAAAELPIRELLLANAPPSVHDRVAPAVTGAVRHAIVSGIVEGELGAVQAAYAEAGLVPVRGMAADGWIAMLLEPGG